MAYIKYLSQEEIPEANRVDDMDNIVQIHGINSEVMRCHYEMYIALMRKRRRWRASHQGSSRPRILVSLASVGGTVRLRR